MIGWVEPHKTAPSRVRRFGYRAAGEWRSLLWGVLFLVVMGGATAGIGLLFAPVMLGLIALVLSFLTGYLMRADETGTGRRPHLPFLYVVGQDERHDAPTGSHGET